MLYHFFKVSISQSNGLLKCLKFETRCGFTKIVMNLFGESNAFVKVPFLLVVLATHRSRKRNMFVPK